ncbi:hypothetical protein [Xanthomonas translucens]|uniref:Uncharacterized protein n=3 Tax=Xanthomonas campestris pv. translucens TaxID=343 RepID=A0A109HG23_XANCT|nr:hypothetical protein [Xanthomonas translucens]KWV11532.1 hypothetical protein ATB53_05960 [Xanthomonas translucens]MCC8446002.1 hypothetical protein [Xanthomonas translucens pv. translucens]MQS40468.1 hypothetical protein [Xanthomonas translucens pv. translucens]QSQ30314.1 hypothetical protein ISN30_19370 [Xanthomonas translucens pv. translucens]QSQ33879.1 hypothetical protein ISN31_19220 [Xanthomonas translucens pv. translucens]
MPIARSSRRAHAPHPALRRVVRQALLAGLALVLVWPAARGSSEWLGWRPLWLLGMPLSAWWALHRFPLPLQPLRRILARGRPRVQARRRRRAPAW